MKNPVRAFLFCLLFVCVICGCADAKVRVGFLAKLNIGEDEYKALLMEERKVIGWRLLSPKHDSGEDFVFYGSLTELQMALARGDIDEAALPQPVAEYVLNTTSEFAIASVEQVRPFYLAFGFSTDSGPKFRERVNEALSAMKSDRKLHEIQEKYLLDPGMKTPEQVEIAHFDGAEVLRIAVTGDMPPVDFVAEDGSPAGFNSAVCAEIGRRLHLNIAMVDIDAGARSAALASGRVDAVFWFQASENVEHQIDVPDGILLSESYYNLDKFLLIKKR